MKSNISITIISLLLFASCSFGGYNKSKDFRYDGSFETSSESVIILKSYKATLLNENLSNDAKNQYIGQMEWCNVETGKCFYTNYKDRRENIRFWQIFLLGPAVGGYLANKESIYDVQDEYIILKIKSGKYFLKNFIINRGIETDGEWNEKENSPTLAYFEVGAGEVLYLGDLSVEICRSIITKNDIAIKIENNDKIAQSSISDNLKFETRLIQSYTKEVKQC